MCLSMSLTTTIELHWCPYTLTAGLQQILNLHGTMLWIAIQFGYINNVVPCSHPDANDVDP